MLISDKISVQIFCQFAKHIGISDVVISPGSRNAPFILSFTNDSFFNCISVIDERSAGFIALGMAKKRKEPVVLVCTSGSATLNYAPAILEAYLQNIPLLIITADRPGNGFKLGQGQCFNQIGIYKNYIDHFYHISENLKQEKIEEILTDAFNKLIGDLNGPMHINFSFDEPLYNTIRTPIIPKISLEQPKPIVKTTTNIFERWKNYKRKLILVLDNDSHIGDQLAELVRNDSSVYVLAENLANLKIEQINHTIDRTINDITFESHPLLKPDLVILIGKNLISKKIRELFKGNDGMDCWSFNNSFKQDFLHLESEHFEIPFSFFLSQISKKKVLSSDFQKKWLDQEKNRKIRFEALCQNIEFSDLWCVQQVIEAYDNVNFFQSNSTAIRYVHLFDYKSSLTFFGNRGVSGVEGCTSTALGMALEADRKTILITGELGFIYDQHAFWNNLGANLTVFVLNNGGGDIFNIIEGPTNNSKSLNYFTTPHSSSLEHIANQYQLKYWRISDKDQLKQSITEIKNQEGIALVELNTTDKKNSSILKNIMNQI